MLISYKDIVKKYNIKTTGVLHIGAHWGEEAPDYYQNGVERTVWVDADAEHMTPLLARLQKYNNYKVFTACLTETDGDLLTFHVSNNEGQSSSILELDHHKIAHPEVHYTKDVQVITKRADTLLAQNNIDIADYSFVNIDVQGAELQVLKGFGDLLHKVQYLYLEINELPLYTLCALLPEVQAYLFNYGLIMVEKKMAGNFGWGDALFSRQIKL